MNPLEQMIERLAAEKAELSKQLSDKCTLLDAIIRELVTVEENCKVTLQNIKDLNATIATKDAVLEDYSKDLAEIQRLWLQVDSVVIPRLSTHSDIARQLHTLITGKHEQS